MHLGEPTKQPLPDKWLADLLAKALLLEYQQPIKPIKRKGKRYGKKVRLHSKKSRGPNESTENEPARSSTTNTGGVLLANIPGRTNVDTPPGAGHPSWQREDVPVFHLFAQVKRLLGRSAIFTVTQKHACVIVILKCCPVCIVILTGKPCSMTHAGSLCLFMYIKWAHQES